MTSRCGRATYCREGASTSCEAVNARQLLPWSPAPSAAEAPAGPVRSRSPPTLSRAPGMTCIARRRGVVTLPDLFSENREESVALSEQGQVLLRTDSCLPLKADGFALKRQTLVDL